MYRQHDLSGLAYCLRTVGVLILGLVGLCGTAQAFAPHQISFQGQILDPNGFPVEGFVTIQTGIWNAPTEGGLLYEEIHAAVPLANGVFDLQLGTGVSTGAGSLSELTEECFADVERYLEVAVDGDVLTPRQQIGSGAYAFQCEVSEQAATAVYAEAAGDADTVDGYHASALNQSAHIGATNNPHAVTAAQLGAASGAALALHTSDTANPHGVTAAQLGAATSASVANSISSHASNASAHHTKTTSFSQLTGQISDSQIPSTITRDSELATVQAQVDALAGQLNLSGVLSIPASALIPRNHSIQYDTNGIRMANSTTGEMQMNAPVFLPQGVRITKVTLEAKDSCGGEFGGRVLLQLLRYRYNSYNNLATVETTSAEAPGDVRRSATLSHVINNSEYSYGISAYIHRSACAIDSIYYYKVIIEYSAS